MSDTIEIDGSVGEGGGQVLRTALSLAAITGQEVTFSNVRAKREKPGLKRQHLTCVNAVAEICGAKVCGNEVGSMVLEFAPEANFVRTIDVHHNYAVFEDHFGSKVCVHRKGATSAKLDETGIIPGSMGTASYIVRGLGNPESFMSCSHGSGRRMSRIRASTTLTVEECDKAMNGIVCERWHKYKGFGKAKGKLDLSEAPQAYKDIEDVIEAERDLVEPLVRLVPLSNLKG